MGDRAERALDFAFARIPSVNRALRPKLLEAYFKLDAFPDAAGTLGALKSRGLRLAILSNGSPQMLAAAVEESKLAASLDAVLSVDAVRAYKPRPEVYALVTDRFRIPMQEVVFVSSNRWDVMGAASFGFSTVWVNRGRLPDEYPDGKPTQVITALAELPALGL